VPEVIFLPGAGPQTEEEILQELIDKLDRAALMSCSDPSRVLMTLYGQASAALKHLREKSN
jgi:hypothetical protein